MSVKACRVLLAFAFLCCYAGRAQPRPTAPDTVWGSRNLPIPERVKVTLEFDRPEYFLGENVLAHFVIENTGTTPFKISQGGDYRGSSRSLRFKVTATDEAGHETADPDPDPSCFGGLVNQPTIKPGGKFTVSVPLVRYREFDAPGKYTVRVSHDLGWQEPTDGRPRSVAEGTVTFRMPDDAQAEKIVAQMEALPEDPNVSQGERSPDYADFAALRQPVYLPALLRRAEKGNARALAGIGLMPTPAATAALIQLAGAGDHEDALDAALTLNNRLPDPQFTGKLPGRGPFDFSQMNNRRRLSQRSWDDKFAPQVRALAARLLKADDGGGNPVTVTHHIHTMNGSLTRTRGDRIGTGAFMIEAVGTVEDAPAVLAAMEPVLQTTTSPRQGPQDNILNDPEPLPELLRAMAALHGRGYALDHGLSGNAQILLYFTWLKGQKAPGNAHWEEYYDAWGTSSPYALREATVRSIPLPLPASCVPKVQKALDDKDLGVCRLACEAAGNSGDKQFLPALLEIIATEDHEWLLRSATGAARQLGAGFELMQTWVDRMGEEHLYPLALDSLQESLDLPAVRSTNGRTDLSRGERLHLRAVWREFLTLHEAELRAGKRFKLDDPAVKPDLFGRARQFRFNDGKVWPPDHPSTE